MYAVARGSTGRAVPVVPSGVVIPTNTTPATMTAANASTQLPPAERPDDPVAFALAA